MGRGGIRRSGISAPGPSSDSWITQHRQLNPRVYEIGASPYHPPRLPAALSLVLSLARHRSRAGPVLDPPAPRLEVPARFHEPLEHVVISAPALATITGPSREPHEPPPERPGRFGWRSGRHHASAVAESLIHASPTLLFRNAIQPVAGPSLCVGDGQNPELRAEVYEDHRVRKAWEQCPPDHEVRGYIKETRE